ncbi:MAG TPA: alpha/beta hydrolase [Crenalkalicoccus sp.]|jgi:pimeloyl-ACP methyl ester carboxylesterase|nr:alpha/beta hydrolase [Crenalkalicoccus sp.]
MPTTIAEDGTELHYREDSFTAPWEEPQAVILLHAGAESGLAWYGWMPRLSSRFRVIRPDMRGFGQSAAMSRFHPWSVAELANDVLTVARACNLQRFHLIAAEAAGPVALRLAARSQERVLSLTLCGVFVSGAATFGSRHNAWLEHIERQGVGSWARAQLHERLGAVDDEAMRAGWAAMLARTNPASLVGFMKALPEFEAGEDIERVTCPTLVMTTDGSTLNTLETTRTWQPRIGQSELMVLAGDGWHVAASHAKDCVGSVMEFYKKNEKKDGRSDRDRNEKKEQKKERRQKERA